MPRYQCPDCESIFNSPRKRKKCPLCKSDQIAETSVNPVQVGNKLGGSVKATGINLFKDDLTEFKDEIKIGRKIYPKKKPPREARDSGLIDVKCSKCSHKEKINRDLILNVKSYLCNDCIIGMGN